MTDPQPDDDDTPGLPPEIEQLLRDLTGGEVDPQLASMMQGMGLDKVDPQMLAMVMGQVQAMFSAPESDTAVNAVLATDIARKTVAAEGDELASAADGRAAAEAVQVAGMWLDAVTDLTTPGLTGAAWSRAEWVEATMPVWTDLVEPVAAGVTDAVGTALEGQLGQLGELGELGDDPGCPQGMLDQAGPMLRRMHGSMFSMQLGPGHRHARPRGAHRLRGLAAAGRRADRRADAGRGARVRRRPRGRRAAGPPLPRRARGRPGAAVRRRAVARPGPARRGARLRGRHQHRHQRHRGGGRLDRPLRPRGRAAGAAGPDVRARALPRRSRPPWPGSRRCSPWSRAGSTSSPTGPPATTCPRPTRSARPCGAAGPPAGRPRRRSGPWSGLELRPRRLRDAANLFAALEDSGGPAARDGAWRHPDLAPSTADLDDPLGYVERAASPQTDEMDAALDRLLSGEDDA